MRTAEVEAAKPSEAGSRRRLAEYASGAWGVLTGLAPHVLHHVGPLAGTALVAGAAGTALFAVIGFVATIPLLLRLRRRFDSWTAPAVALLLFAVMFSLSAFVIGPRIRSELPVPASAESHESHPGHVD